MPTIDNLDCAIDVAIDDSNHTTTEEAGGHLTPQEEEKLEMHRKQAVESCTKLLDAYVDSSDHTGSRTISSARKYDEVFQKYYDALSSMSTHSAESLRDDLDDHLNYLLDADLVTRGEAEAALNAQLSKNVPDSRNLRRANQRRPKARVRARQQPNRKPFNASKRIAESKSTGNRPPATVGTKLHFSAGPAMLMDAEARLTEEDIYRSKLQPGFRRDVSQVASAVISHGLQAMSAVLATRVAQGHVFSGIDRMLGGTAEDDADFEIE